MMDTENVKPTGWSKRVKLALAATALVGVGAVGAFAVGATRPSVEMAPVTPVAIRTLADSTNIVTVRGQVAEVYGNKFVLADASGKTLIETGRSRDFGGLVTPAPLVTAGQQVTVQGRFDRGYLRASFLIGADGKIISLRAIGGGGGGSRDRDDRGRRGDGPHGDRGPRGESPPSPVAPVTPTAPAAAPAQQ